MRRKAKVFIFRRSMAGVHLDIVLEYLIPVGVLLDPEQAGRLCYVGCEAADKVAQASRLHLLARTVSRCTCMAGRRRK